VVEFRCRVQPRRGKPANNHFLNELPRRVMCFAGQQHPALHRYGTGHLRRSELKIRADRKVKKVFRFGQPSMRDGVANCART
jgi:hypothetical protein